MVPRVDNAEHQKLRKEAGNVCERYVRAVNEKRYKDSTLHTWTRKISTMLNSMTVTAASRGRMMCSFTASGRMTLRNDGTIWWRMQEHGWSPLVWCGHKVSIYCTRPSNRYSPHKRCSEQIAARSSSSTVNAQWSYRRIVAVFGNLGLNARQPAASVHGAENEMLKFWGKQDVPKSGMGKIASD